MLREGLVINVIINSNTTIGNDNVKSLNNTQGVLNNKNNVVDGKTLTSIFVGQI